MCFPYDAHPPIPAIAGAAVDYRDIVLESADGTKFAAFAATSGNANASGIVVLPDVRGLFRFYEELALRFAERGVNAVAIDYFGRTAGVSKRDEEFPYMEHVKQTKLSQISEDVGASLEYLRSPAGGSCTSLFTVGFCFGGSNSWMQATAGHGLAGVIGFYGRPGPSFVDESPGPMQRVHEFTCPVLGLMGGADQGIPKEAIDAFDGALAEAGVEHELMTYAGAPHSFFDRSFEVHKDTAADAWQRCLDFIAKRSAALNAPA